MKRKNSAVMDGLDYIDPDIRPLARPIGDLNPDPANARKHPDRNLEAIKSSLARFGQKKPLVARPVNGSLIVVAGNGTLAAAKALGWTYIAVSVKEMSDAEATAYGIADNKTAELAEWDDEVLAGLLGSLDADPRYVDVAVQRWCNFTGKDATRESDGAKWSELSGKSALSPAKKSK